MTEIRQSTTMLLMFGLLICLGCGDGPEPGFGQVSGKVTIDGQPAPEGTRIRFQHKEDSSSFMTVAKEDGSYNYKPPREAPLQEGDYLVSVEPITTTTRTDESGLSVSEEIPGAPKSYGKFSDPKQSGLEVTLSSSSVDYDIAVTK
jgi:hypothetical protein